MPKRLIRRRCFSRTRAMLAVAALASVGDLRLVMAQTIQTFTLPPINGFQPLVMFGMTDEQINDTGGFELNDFYPQPSSTPGGNGVPSHRLPVNPPAGQTAWPAFVAVVD